MKKWVVRIGLLVLVSLGFLVFSSMTGGFITGSTMNNKIIKDVYADADLGTFDNYSDLELKEVEEK